MFAYQEKGLQTEQFGISAHQVTMQATKPKKYYLKTFYWKKAIEFNSDGQKRCSIFDDSEMEHLVKI